jgi:hypothetical protein
VPISAAPSAAAARPAAARHASSLGCRSGAVLAGSRQPLAEALPGGLLGYSDPVPDLRPRAPRLPRIRHEVADQVVGARRQLFADHQRGRDPVER